MGWRVVRGRRKTGDLSGARSDVPGEHDGPAASVVGGQQPEDARAADGVPPVVHAERREEVLDVVADAVAGQPERGADLSVFVGVEAREDFGLPRGQPRRQRRQRQPRRQRQNGRAAAAQRRQQRGRGASARRAVVAADQVLHHGRTVRRSRTRGRA